MQLSIHSRFFQVCTTEGIRYDDALGVPPKSPRMGDFEPQHLVSKSPTCGGFRGLKPLTTLRRVLSNSSFIHLIALALGVLVLPVLDCAATFAQTATSNQNSTIGAGSSFNQVLQSSPQVPVSNATNVNVPNIYPLQNLPNAFVNTENDFGMNLSVGMNTLDASNVTVYLGLIYQPGRSDDHRARMLRLRRETELLEVQKKNMETNLTLLQKQIEEANLRLQKLQRSP